MHHARASIDPAFVVAPLNRRVFGSLVEHMGRCVYTGLYEPGHPTAGLRGFDGGTLVEAVVLADEDLDRVLPRAHPDASVSEGELSATLPPASWSMPVLEVG